MNSKFAASTESCPESPALPTGAYGSAGATGGAGVSGRDSSFFSGFFFGGLGGVILTPVSSVGFTSGAFVSGSGSGSGVGATAGMRVGSISANLHDVRTGHDQRRRGAHREQRDQDRAVDRPRSRWPNSSRLVLLARRLGHEPERCDPAPS